MIAVVYSGSKNSFWKIFNEGKTVAECTISSINPNFYDQKQTLALLNKTIALINHAEQVKKMYVFAAGSNNKVKQEELKGTLCKFFINSKIRVRDDITGAAIAACQDRTGIVGVLGSGANCAYFNGKKPEDNNFGLGYILADEGSSNYLGKMLLKNYLEEKLPLDLRKKLEIKHNLDRPTVLERIYKKANAQAYLSSFLDFFIENQENKFIQRLIDDAFDTYIKLYVLPTTAKHPDQSLHFVGLIAGSFEERLRDAAAKHQLKIETIIKEPIYNLLNYYSN